MADLKVIIIFFFSRPLFLLSHPLFPFFTFSHVSLLHAPLWFLTTHSELPPESYCWAALLTSAQIMIHKKLSLIQLYQGPSTPQHQGIFHENSGDFPITAEDMLASSNCPRSFPALLSSVLPKLQIILLSSLYNLLPHVYFTISLLSLRRHRCRFSFCCHGY